MLPAETHVPKILTDWNKLILPRIKYSTSRVCYISRVTKKIPRLHRFTALDGHTSHHRSTLGPSLPSPRESVGEAERNWTFCGGRCENSMRRPKHRLVTEILLYICTSYLIFVSSKYMIIHSSMRIYGQSILFMMLRRNMYLIDLNCMLSGRNVPKMMAYQKYHKWCGPFAKGLLHTIPIPFACAAGSRKPAGFRRNWPQARKQSSSSKRWSWKERNGTTYVVGKKSMQLTIWAIKYQQWMTHLS